MYIYIYKCVYISLDLNDLLEFRHDALKRTHLCSFI